jgi:multiple antibiotic resistance protein
MDQAILVNFGIAMIAIVNPVGKVPLWLHASEGQNGPVRARLALMLVATAFAILVASLLFGRQILEVFGIDLAAFRIGGGIVILRVGLAMLSGTDVEVSQADAQGDLAPYEEAKLRYRSIVVPMAMPIIAGPGAISTAIVYGSRIDDWPALGIMALTLLLVMTIVLGVLLISHRLKPWVGDVALDVQTRIFGLLLTAIAAQLIVEGLGEVFPSWLTETSEIADDVGASATPPGSTSAP